MFNNKVISMNLFRFVYFVSQRLMRLWRKSYHRRNLAAFLLVECQEKNENK
jgi:hypothetical protein